MANYVESMLIMLFSLNNVNYTEYYGVYSHTLYISAGPTEIQRPPPLILWALPLTLLLETKHWPQGNSTSSEASLKTAGRPRSFKLTFH